MRQVTGNATSVVRGIDRVMAIFLFMVKSEVQFTDLEVQTNIMGAAMSSTAATSAPQDQVDQLVKPMAEEADIELELDIVDLEQKSEGAIF
jgi:charged multivesicular body protein 1